jgi:hypothetical protein
MSVNICSRDAFEICCRKEPIITWCRHPVYPGHGRPLPRQNSGHRRTPTYPEQSRPTLCHTLPYSTALFLPAGQPREHGDTRIDKLERDSVSFGSPPLPSQAT